MLEEIEVAHPLDLGVVHRVLPGRLAMGEAAAGRKIDADRQPPLRRIEIDGLDIRISNGVSQSGYNNFGMVQDVTYQTSAIGADSAGGRISGR